MSTPIDPPAFARRSFLQSAAAAAALPLGLAAPQPLSAASARPSPCKRALFVWLAGGSSQFETWDPKPGTSTGGPFRTVATRTPGYSVSELMPKLAALTDKFAVIRSLNTEISEHEMAADLISTGRPKEAALKYPEIGVVLARELATPRSPLPDYISFFLTSEGRRRPATGYLGARHSPLLLERSLRPEHITLPAGLTAGDHAAREELRRRLSERFAQGRAGSELAGGYDSAFDKVRGLMDAERLFDLDREPAAQQARYGRTPFGRQCLTARRLLEAGVPVVKVARGFWDSHHDNFESHRELVPDFDRVFSALLTDLDERGLLASTLVIVLSEFGRTPIINKDVGRDHYAAAWSCVLAGAGIRNGTVYGKTDDEGKSVLDGEANAGDLAATIYKAAGIDLGKHDFSGPRPIPLVKEDAQPIDAVLA